MIRKRFLLERHEQKGYERLLREPRFSLLTASPDGVKVSKDEGAVLQTFADGKKVAAKLIGASECLVFDAISIKIIQQLQKRYRVHCWEGRRTIFKIFQAIEIDTLKAS